MDNKFKVERIQDSANLSYFQRSDQGIDAERDKQRPIRLDHQSGIHIPIITSTGEKAWCRC